MKWRLTGPGWIEACSLLRGEIELDQRFGVLSGYLKGLAAGRKLADTSTQAVSTATGLSEQWVFDAIEGKMAETIYGQYGAYLLDKMGGVEIPAHIGNKITE